MKLFGYLSLIHRQRFFFRWNRTHGNIISSSINLTTYRKLSNSRRRNNQVSKNSKDIINHKSITGIHEHAIEVDDIDNILKKNPKTEVEDIFNAFISLLENVNQRSIKVQDAKMLKVRKIWSAVFSISNNRPANVVRLQEMLYPYKDIYVNMLFNHARYDLYLEDVKPLYERNSIFKSALPSISEKAFIMSEFQISSTGFYHVNEEKVLSSITNGSKDESRQILITIFKKRYLFTPKENHLDAAKLFLRGMMILNDLSDFTLTKTPIYRQSFLMMQQISEILPFIRDFFSERNAPNFYLSTLSILQTLSSQVHHYDKIMNIWKEKVRFDQEHRELNSLKSSDLTITMQACLDAGHIQDTLELYNGWKHLHDDSQITILLKVAEKERNWSILQEQFEDMYGRGNLPHLVHYGIVMNALASIGAKDETILLFEQLIERKFVPDKLSITAVINAYLFYSEYEEASAFQNKWSLDESEFVYSLWFKHFSIHSQLDKAIEWFNKANDKFKKTGIVLLTPVSIIQLLKLTKDHYALAQFLKVWEVAKAMRLVDIKVYREMIVGCTKLNLFELAEEISNQFHEINEHPATSGIIYAAQLKNLKAWQLNTEGSSNRHQIFKNIRKVFKRYEGRNIIASNAWHAEVIKYHLSNNQLNLAETELKKIIHFHYSILSEKHFHPFMKFFNQRKTVVDANKVLEIFKQMNKLKVPVTIQSYKYLMDALLLLDIKNGTGFRNSTNLLEAIYKMYDFTLPTSTPSSQQHKKVPPEITLQNSKILGAITSSYIRKSHDFYYNGDELLLSFINQVQQIGGTNILQTMIHSLYKTVLPYYLQKPGYDSKSLVESVLKDISRSLDQYINEYKEKVSKTNIRISPELNDSFAYFLKAKIDHLEQDGLSDKDLETLQLVNKYPIKYKRDFLHQVAYDLLSLNNNLGLKDCLELVENNLIAGNQISLANHFAKLNLLKKLFFYEMSLDSEYRNQIAYKPLLAYYGISFREVLKEANEVQYNNLENDLKKALKNYTEKYSMRNPINLSNLIENKRHFFLFKDLATGDAYANFKLIGKLINAMKNFYPHNKQTVFEWMSSYQETIETLTQLAKRQYVEKLFMNKIDKIVPRRANDRGIEPYEMKKSRIIRAISIGKMDDWADIN